MVYWSYLIAVGKATNQSMLMESSKNRRKTRQKKVKGDSSPVEEETRSD